MLLSLEVLECSVCGGTYWKIYYDDNGFYIFCLQCENEKTTNKPDYVVSPSNFLEMDR
jgi:hypothetical protein